MLLVSPPGETAEIAWARRALSGQELIEEHDGQPMAMLSLTPSNDQKLHGYVGESEVWSTVTPEVMLGHDDGDARKAERLFRRALGHAGLSLALAAAAELEWPRVEFLPGVEFPQRHHLPGSLIRLPSYHVRLRWGRKVRDPLFVGTGRYRGRGVFAAEGKNALANAFGPR